MQLMFSLNLKRNCINRADAITHCIADKLITDFQGSEMKDEVLSP